MNIPFLDFSYMHLPIYSDIKEAFYRVYESNWFILGKEVEYFEKNYSIFNQVNFTIGTSNGLDALYLALKACGVKKGDEVLIPSNTYIATLLAVSYLGAKPTFVEPRIDTYNINPKLIEESITNKTKAIMPVHLYGQSCEMNEIMDIADKYKLKVIEDNAQSHLSKFNGKLTGSWGHANGTSFYPGKNLGSLGDSGAVTTNDKSIADKIRILRNYGSNVKYHNDLIGHNMRLDELQAAFLSVKMKCLSDWTNQRNKIAIWYKEALKDIPQITLPYTHPDATHVFHLFVIRTTKRDELQKYLNEHRIGTLIHYPIPPYLQKAYKSLKIKKGDFPIAEEISDTCLSLPIWPGMTENNVLYISEKIKKFIIEQ